MGDAIYGKPVDVWAIGCLFAEMLTGIPLFPGSSDIDTLHQILKQIGASLTQKQLDAFYNNPLYQGVKVGGLLYVAPGDGRKYSGDKRDERHEISASQEAAFA